MKERAATGMGSIVKHAQVISYTDEEMMLNSGILGTSNPEQLVNTLLFLLGIHCTLCTGSEHCNLRSLGKNSQFKYRVINGVINGHLIYNEDLGMKTNRGGLKHKQNPAKEVIIFPQSNRARYPMAIFYLYHCKIPINRKTEALYLHPRKNYTPDQWYED